MSQVELTYIESKINFKIKIEIRPSHIRPIFFPPVAFPHIFIEMQNPSKNEIEMSFKIKIKKSRILRMFWDGRVGLSAPPYS